MGDNFNIKFTTFTSFWFIIGHIKPKITPICHFSLFNKEITVFYFFFIHSSNFALKLFHMKHFYLNHLYLFKLTATKPLFLLYFRKIINLFIFSYILNKKTNSCKLETVATRFILTIPYKYFYKYVSRETKHHNKYQIKTPCNHAIIVIKLYIQHKSVCNTNICFKQNIN